MINLGYRTPEEAALAQWDKYPRADVRVIEVRYEGDHDAVVVTDTDPSHPMFNRCKRTDDGWVFRGDHN